MSRCTAWRETSPVARLAASNFLGDPTVPIGYPARADGWQLALTPARRQLPSAAGRRRRPELRTGFAATPCRRRCRRQGLLEISLAGSDPTVQTPMAERFPLASGGGTPTPSGAPAICRHATSILRRGRPAPDRAHLAARDSGRRAVRRRGRGADRHPLRGGRLARLHSRGGAGIGRGRHACRSGTPDAASPEGLWQPLAGRGRGRLARTVRPVARTAGRRDGGSCEDRPVSRRGVLLFAALGLAWGIPYLLIKIAVQEVDPAVVVLGAQRARRCRAAAARARPRRCCRCCAAGGRCWPTPRRDRHALVLPQLRRAAAAQLDRRPAPRRGAAGRGRGRVLLGRPARSAASTGSASCSACSASRRSSASTSRGSDLIGVGEMASSCSGTRSARRSSRAGCPTSPASASSRSRWRSRRSSTCRRAAVGVLARPACRPPPAIGSIVTLAAVCSAAAFLLMFALIAEIGPCA